MLGNYNLVKYSLSNDNKLRVSMAVLDRGVLCYNFINPLLYTDAYKNWHPNLDFDYEYCGLLRPTYIHMYERSRNRSIGSTYL